MKELFSNIKENFNSGLETLQHIFEFYQSIKNNTDLSEIEKQPHYAMFKWIRTRLF